MRLFSKAPDGGKDSGVTAYFLIEWKNVFSVALLRFDKGSRKAYHTHAFNALTWWLKGDVTEINRDTGRRKWFTPSLKPKFTSRECSHKIYANEVTWALTFRGPWKDTWKEFGPEGEVTLTHGRKEIQAEP